MIHHTSKGVAHVTV